MSSFLRYRLDELGWYQFEWLVQVILKAGFGVGIESWGGNHDEGKDAYYTGRLRFPGKVLTHGPYIFQAKFVQNANAAGANCGAALLNAVRAEALRIEARMGTGWVAPKQYALFTNAPLTSGLRKRIRELLEAKLAHCIVTPFGGNDVCDLLDAFPGVKRGFPQLLGLRDLNELISSALSKGGLQKSQAAINLAEEIAPTFVPTAAFLRGRDVLNRHHFVVLEGPPEMGKTAIAWMLALQQTVEGWQAIVCNEPGEIFSSFDRDLKQVFVADDAFGRTEYDVARGKKWELELPRVLSLLNSKHWLIWTSRKHVLERGVVPKFETRV